MEAHRIQQKSKEHDGTVWNSIEGNGTGWDQWHVPAQEYHGNLWNRMECDGTTGMFQHRKPMEAHGTGWKGVELENLPEHS